MSDDSQKSGQSLAKPRRDVVPAKNELLAHEPLIQKLFALEHERLSIERGQIEVTLKMAELTDAADERQFTFHMARLDEEKDRRKADDSRFWQISRILVGTSATFGIIILSLLGMVFFGNATQSETALQVLKRGIEVVFSGSFFMLFIVLIRRLLRRR